MEWRDNRLRLPDGRWLGYGECGDPHGRPVVYCHGGLSSRLDIAFAGRACERLGVRLLAVDRPGVGLSDYRRVTLLDWPADVSALADSLGLDRFEVLGWSLGGAHALACGLGLADRVTRVSTVGGVAPLEWPGAIDCLGALPDRILLRWGPRIPGLAQAILWLSSWVPPKLLKWLVLRELSSAADREVVTAMGVPEATDFVFEALRTGVRGTAADYQRVARSWGFTLEQLRVPVDIYWGDEDRLCPRAHADYLAEHLLGGRLHVLPGRGHFLLHQELEAVLYQR
jgi:pimeloyl-ACP methyl ester carboxylesterase